MQFLSLRNRLLVPTLTMIVHGCADAPEPYKAGGESAALTSTPPCRRGDAMAPL
jgi:hypothetical protein